MSTNPSFSISGQIIAEFEEDASLYKPSVPEYVPIESLPKNPDRVIFNADAQQLSQSDRDVTTKPLAESCVYTILHPDKLAKAAALRGPSTFVVGQRMVTAATLHRTAHQLGKVVAVLFGDATDCNRLVYWGLLTAIDVGEADTHYTVFPVHPLNSDRSPQELILRVTGELIAPGFIHTYAICGTPEFLTNAAEVECPTP